MSDKFPPTAQRAALLKFADALGSRPIALGRDDCGDPVIVGRSGHIYAVPGASSKACGRRRAFSFIASASRRRYPTVST